MIYSNEQFKIEISKFDILNPIITIYEKTEKINEWTWKINMIAINNTLHINKQNKSIINLLKESDYFEHMYDSRTKEYVFELNNTAKLMIL